MDAQRAAAESLAGAASTVGPFMERQRTGRVEAETRRVSEEVTRQAQERLKAAREEREVQAAESSAAEERITTIASDMALTPIRRILVPLDGTPFAERAPRVATATCTPSATRYRLWHHMVAASWAAGSLAASPSMFCRTARSL
jgi:hypothetical protein